MKPIHLLYAENVISRHGPHLRQRVLVCTSVENWGYGKSVDVHFAGEDAHWHVVASRYVRRTADREIWMAEAVFDSSLGNLPGHVDFAVRCYLGTQEWWDNHSGHNYRIEADSGVLLGDDVDVLNLEPDGLLPSRRGPFAVTIAVRESLRPCNVELLWTIDRWRSVCGTSCHFSRHFWHRTRVSGARNPNRYGVGIWTCQITLQGVARMDYAIVCGSTRGAFWDNNRGENYIAHRAQLRVLTLNLHCFQESDWDAKLWTIARLINEQEVDIVCLQEVGEPWNEGRGNPPGNAARILRDRLNQPYHIAADWSHIGFGSYREGSAILSRYEIPLKDSRYVSAANDIYSIHSRKVVMAQVDVPHLGRVNVFSTHLSWWKDGFQSQFEALRRWVEEAHRNGVVASLLCGDFNADPSSEGYGLVTQQGEFEDQFVKAQARANGWSTSLCDNGRIDYIFMKKGGALEVSAVRPVFTESDYGPVSDHPGYYAEFDLVSRMPTRRLDDEYAD